MQLSLNTSSILERLDEFQAVLVLGRRSVPFLEETLRFVRDVVPLLDEVDASIRDSVGQIPSATAQIASVSEASEMAATEILDLVDGVLAHIDQGTDCMVDIAAYAGTIHQCDEDLYQRLRTALQDGPPDMVASVEAAFDERRARLQQLQDKIEAQEKALAAMRSQMTSIMIALQVQDITAQQLASVNHLIESMRSRMASLINALNTGAGATVDTAHPVDPGTFDAGARYDKTDRRQHEADHIVRAFSGKGGTPSTESTSVPPATARGDGGIHPPENTDAHSGDADPRMRKGYEGVNTEREGSPCTTAGGHPPAVAQDDLEAETVESEVATQDDIDALFQQFGT